MPIIIPKYYYISREKYELYVKINIYLLIADWISVFVLLFFRVTVFSSVKDTRISLLKKE